MLMETLERVVLESGAIFNSHAFLLLILPITLAGYWAFPQNSWKIKWLIAMSALFYSLYDARFLLLIYGSATFDFFISKRIPASKHANFWLSASLCLNLGALAFFKYSLFVAENVVSLANLLGQEWKMPLSSIVLPVGISFYTFQTISYTVDVYRDNIKPAQSFTKFLCYVSMFPQLVAGPIVRYIELDNQLSNIPTAISKQQSNLGISLFILGLSKKVLVADSIAPMVNDAWTHADSIVSSWVAMLGYSAQLYFDFSGYSDMAVGLGLLLGLRLPWNFDAPYQARNPREFWRKWHITLGRFLTDYLYKPLGGNREKRIRNLMIVMLLGGLWHGAAWTFIVWGCFHGFLLVAYQVLQNQWDRQKILLQKITMFSMVSLGWVMFRASSLSEAFQIYAGLFSGTLGEIPDNVWMILAALTFAFLVPSSKQTAESWRISPSKAVFLGILLFANFLAIGQGENVFLYYDF